MDSSGHQNADERASRMTSRRNDLRAQIHQLNYKLNAISNQLGQARSRLRDLECAAEAPLHQSSRWNANTHGAFVQNIAHNSACLRDTCNRLTMEKREVECRIEQLNREIDSLGS